MLDHKRDRLVALHSVISPGAVAIAVLAAMTLGAPALAQTDSRAEISAPPADAVLQGTVHVLGTAQSSVFASAELAFAYATDASNTWFIVAILDQPVSNAEIAGWDTTTITDGDYILRLRVNALDGTFQETTVSVQVRNYTAAPMLNPTPVPTQTPALQIPSPIVIRASKTPEPTLPPTPTRLPPNPAAASPADIYGGFMRGALVVFTLSIVVGVVFLRRRP